MSTETVHYGLSTTPVETDKMFLEWRQEIDGETDSNMTKIDEILFSKADSSFIAEDYDNEHAYSEGEYAIFDGVLKKYNGTEWIIASIGADLSEASIKSSDAVAYTAQTGKTDAQKQRARDNIAAAGRTEVEPLINQWDEQWMIGRWNQTSGGYEPMTDRICSANYIPVKPSTQYYVHAPSGFLMVFYDSNFSRISQATLTGAGTFTTPSNTAYMNFTLGTGYGTTYNHDISINYPATYTGYYPANYSGVKNSLGKLGNAIANGGWNQRAVLKSYAWSSGAENKTFGGTINFISGHIWLFLAYQANTMTSILRNTLNYRIGGTTVYQAAFENHHLNAGWHTWRVTIAETGSGYFGFWVNTPSGAYTLDNVQGFDLTEIFGAGNEPSIEQFRQLFPDDYYPYHVPHVTLNKNLLDNPWFTVNQRNITSASLSGTNYYLDRWKSSYRNSAGTISLSSSGLTLTPAIGDDVQMIQLFEDSATLNGKTLTASVMFSDGNIISGTITRTNDTQQYFFRDASYELDMTSANGFHFRTTSSVTIRAVKLELGAVSTLANDFPPNYGEELAKCQRYFVRLEPSSTASHFGLGAKNGSDHSLIVPVSLPTTLRVKPTVTVSDPIVVLTGPSSKVLTDATVTVGAWTKSNIIPLTITHSEISSSNVYLLWKNSGYIDFSADL